MSGSPPSLTWESPEKQISEWNGELIRPSLGGDVRANQKLSGTKHNVFGIQTGVAISFMVKRYRAKGCRIYYSRRPEFETAEEKLEFLSNAKLGELSVDEIRPDEKNNWLNLTTNDFQSLIPIATKESKLAKRPSKEKTVFKLFSLGIVTNRDEWTYANSPAELGKKIRYFCDTYEKERHRWNLAGRPKNTADFVSREIKWTSELEAHLRRGTVLRFDDQHINDSLYRPFVRRVTYFAPVITHRPYQNAELFPQSGCDNLGFSVAVEERVPFGLIATKWLPNKDLFLPSCGQVFALYRYDQEQNKISNITDWALEQFKKHYQPGRIKHKRPITKEAIFQYVYGVLHDPLYREKYAQNLKKEFPRIPFYVDFWQWADWGKELMDLHTAYEQVEPIKLIRTDIPDEKSRKAGVAPKALLKADKDASRILLDSETMLSGIPPQAWSYTLGNRSALEWILDQYKEKKPKDPTIRQKFDTYRFVNHKEQVIDLLLRVTTVSVRTVAIMNDMKRAQR
jgi:predicted helicase